MIYKVKSADGVEKAVSEANISKAEADGFYPIVTNGKEEKRVKVANLEKAKASGFVLKEDVPLVKSALGGLSQGLTMGFGDEILGAVEGGGNYLLDRAAHAVEGVPYEGDSLKESYQKARDERRLAYGESARQNPKTEMVGQVVGGITSSVAAPVSTSIKGVAGISAVNALGSSDADLTEGDLLGVAKDTAIGTGAGLAIYGAGNLVGKGVKAGKNWLGSGEAVKNAAAGTADFLGDLPKEIGKKIINNPNVKSVSPKSNQILAESVENSANSLKKELAKESSIAWDGLKALDEKYRYAAARTGNPDSIFDFVPDSNTKSIRQEFEGLGLEIAREMKIIGSEQAAQKSALKALASAEKDLVKANTYQDLKTLVQNIDDNIDWDKVDKTVTNEALTRFRTNIDKILKSDRDYLSNMKSVSEKAQNLDELVKKFGLKKGKDGFEYTDRTVSITKNLVTDMQKDVKPALKKTVETVNPTLADDFDTASIYNKSRGDTGRGSRSVVGGGLATAAVGGVLGGPVGGLVTGAVGGLLGLARDKYGRQVASTLLAKSSGAIKGSDVIAQKTAVAIDAAWDNLSEPMKKVLANAAERGPAALISTWTTLKNKEDSKPINGKDLP
jgi:hypothetical protein